MKLNAIHKSPRDVTQMISEDEPIMELKRAGTGTEEEKGSIVTVSKLSDWIQAYNKDMAGALQEKDVRLARLRLLEIRAACDQIQHHIELIAQDMGLPELTF